MNEGDRLGGRYEVLRTVSVGRRASVLQALDHVHNCLVALKVYPVSGDDHDAMLAEAQVLMNLTAHPALPRVRGDFFTDADANYVIVMNWIDGTNMQDVLEAEGDPGLPFDVVLDCLAQAADALGHLHAHDPAIVHGDVKPANLVRTPAGRVVLVDFDVAATQVGRGPSGTIGFVAPEVAAGEKPQPAADVYGLAATAMTLLSGHPPTDGPPILAGVGQAQRAQLARVLRSAMATDASQRPRPIGKFVEQLRKAERVELPSGAVAFLGTEVVDAGPLWDADPDGMQSAMTRLRDLRDAVIERHGGQVVASMNEGDRSITVFRDAPDAARCALDLHDRLAHESFPPGIDVRLRAAVAAGEAQCTNGVYGGALVERVVYLRSRAGPEMTLTSEMTAERLLGLVGNTLSIVPLAADATRSSAGPVFALTRPGHEAAAISAGAAPASVDSERGVADEPPTSPKVSRAGAAMTALEEPVTLALLTALGLAVIFRVLLAAELELEAFGAIAVGVLLCAFASWFVWRYTTITRAQQTKLTEAALELELVERERVIAEERAASRRRLAAGFAALRTESGDEGTHVLNNLADQFDAIDGLARKGRDRESAPLPTVIPHLAEEAYRHGMSALSDALELVETAEGPARRRLQNDLDDVEERLASDRYTDDRRRERDERRLVTHRQLLARHDDSLHRAQELMFEAERCTVALTEAHLELASLRAGNTQVDVDAIVETLQHTIRRVREVQDEFRRLGY